MLYNKFLENQINKNNLKKDSFNIKEIIIMMNLLKIMQMIQVNIMLKENYGYQVNYK